MRNGAIRNGKSPTRRGGASRRRTSLRAVWFLGITTAAAAVLTSGSACVEIAGLLGVEGVGSDPGGGGGGGGDGDTPDGGGDGTDDALAVRISASNVTPVVGEEVLLVCALVSADDAGVSFSFEPANLLITDGTSSSASLIADASLIGQAISVTCRARMGGDEGPPADPVTVTVTGP